MWSFTSLDLQRPASCPRIGDGQSEEGMAAEQLQRAGTFTALVALLLRQPATSLPSSLIWSAVWLL